MASITDEPFELVTHQSADPLISASPRRRTHSGQAARAGVLVVEPADDDFEIVSHDTLSYAGVLCLGGAVGGSESGPRHPHHRMRPRPGLALTARPRLAPAVAAPASALRSGGRGDACSALGAGHGPAGPDDQLLSPNQLKMRRARARQRDIEIKRWLRGY